MDDYKGLIAALRTPGQLSASQDYLVRQRAADVIEELSEKLSVAGFYMREAQKEETKAAWLRCPPGPSLEQRLNQIATSSGRYEGELVTMGLMSLTTADGSTGPCGGEADCHGPDGPRNDRAVVGAVPYKGELSV